MLRKWSLREKQFKYQNFPTPNAFTKFYGNPSNLHTLLISSKSTYSVQNEVRVLAWERFQTGVTKRWVSKGELRWWVNYRWVTKSWNFNCPNSIAKNPPKWNRNHSMADAKNFNRYKRLINRQLLQVSGLCDTPFFSYLPKRWTQIYRAQYGDAICIYINTSHNVLTVQTAKNLKKRPFFETRQFCHGAVLRSRTAEILKIQDAVFWTQRMLPSWKLVKRYIFTCSFTWWQ